MRAVAIILAGCLALLGFDFVGVASASSVGGAAVSLSSTSEGATEVTYSLSFTATSGLTGGTSTISVSGPSGTVFPTTDSCGGDYGVAVNGGAAVTCGASLVSGGGTNSIVLTDPTTATAGQTVALTVNGATNATATGTKMLSVSTSTDTTAVTPSFELVSTTAVTNASLDVTSTSANATGVKYTETMQATNGMTGGFSTLTVTAPSGTVFPATDSCGGDYSVSISGGSPVFCGASVVSGAGTNVVTVTDPTSAPAGQELQLFITGVQNTGTTGTQTVKIATSSDPAQVSESLDITAETSLTAVTAHLTSTSASATGVTYTFTGTLTNAITANSSTFTVAAPPGASFPSSASCGGDYSVAVNAEPAVNCGTSLVTIPGTNTVTFGSPVDAVAGDTVTVTINDVSNSATSGTQSVAVSTSSDPAAVMKSIDFTPVTSISGLSAVPGSTTASATNVTYTVDFTSTNGMTAGVSTLTLTAPAGTVFPSDGSCGGKYAMGIGSGSDVTCGSTVVSGGGTNAVTVHSSVGPVAGDHVTVTISGVTNPPDTSAAELSVSTSSDPGVVAAALFGGSPPPPPPPTTTVTSTVVPVSVSPTIVVTYAATDRQSTIASYDVRYRSAAWNGKFGAYTYPKQWQHTKHTTERLRGTPGHEYCFNVRSRNHSGQVSGWTKDWCRTLPLDDRALKAITTGWRRGTGSHYYMHTITRSTRRGAKLRLRRAHVHRLALIVKKCPKCGKVSVSVNGVTHTVSTHAASTRYQAIILLPAVKLKSATIVVRAKGKNVFIDGIAVIEK